MKIQHILLACGLTALTLTAALAHESPAPNQAPHSMAAYKVFFISPKNDLPAP